MDDFLLYVCVLDASPHFLHDYSFLMPSASLNFFWLHGTLPHSACFLRQHNVILRISSFFLIPSFRLRSLFSLTQIFFLLVPTIYHSSLLSRHLRNRCMGYCTQKMCFLSMFTNSQTFLFTLSHTQTFLSLRWNDFFVDDVIIKIASLEINEFVQMSSQRQESDLKWKMKKKLFKNKTGGHEKSWRRS